MRAIRLAGRDEEDRTGLARRGDRAQRFATGQRDGGRRQASAYVGVVGRVGLQVAAADVAVVALADTVDDRGIGLQAHALAQARRVDASHHRSLGRQRRFLLDDRGEDQRLVGRGDRQIGAARRPGGLQLRRHLPVGELQDLAIGRAVGEAESIREEPAFRMLARVVERRHHLGIGAPPQCRLDARVGLQRAPELEERGALDHRQRFEHHIAILELREDLTGGGARQDVVGAGAHFRTAAVQAQPQLDKARIAERAAPGQRREHGAQPFTRAHVHPYRPGMRPGRLAGGFDRAPGDGGTDERQHEKGDQGEAKRTWHDGSLILQSRNALLQAAHERPGRLAPPALEGVNRPGADTHVGEEDLACRQQLLLP